METRMLHGTASSVSFNRYEKQRAEGPVRRRSKTFAGGSSGHIRRSPYGYPPSQGEAHGGTARQSSRKLFMALPLDAIKTPEPNELIVALHLDDAGQSDERAENSVSDGHHPYRREWNGILRLYNLLQFIPNAWWTTARGVEHHMYPEFTIPDDPPEEPDSSAWSEAIALAVPDLHPMMRALSAQDIPAPEVGFELTNVAGEVVAEAELVWEAKRIAVLLPSQERQLFVEAGWLVFLPDAPDLAAALTE